MATPARYTAYAARYAHLRWRFLGISVGTLAAALALATLAATPAWPFPIGPAEIFSLAAPIIFVSWGLLCMCVWFHPRRGSLRPTSRWQSWLPSWANEGMRWYAALFLTLFFVASLLFPALSLTR